MSKFHRNLGFSLAGYGYSSYLSRRSIRLLKEHRRDDWQLMHYADDWDREGDEWDFGGRYYGR